MHSDSRQHRCWRLAAGYWVSPPWHIFTGRVPSVPTMGVVGTCALLANGVVAGLLFRYREGDSNMRSVWLCTRNDVLGNVAVLLAALGVFGTGSAWPDLAVAAIMSTLAVTSAGHIVRQTTVELRDHADEHEARGRPRFGGYLTAHACTDRPREVHPAEPCTIIPAITRELRCSTWCTGGLLSAPYLNPFPFASITKPSMLSRRSQWYRNCRT